jgi:hypothetical protein
LLRMLTIFRRLLRQPKKLKINGKTVETVLQTERIMNFVVEKSLIVIEYR